MQKEKMSNISIVPFEAVHGIDILTYIMPINQTINEELRKLEQGSTDRLIVTIMNDDIPVACPFLQIAGNMADVGMFLRVGSPLEPIVESLKTFLRVSLEANNLERLQVTILRNDNNLEYRKLLDDLGFTFEKEIPGGDLLVKTE